MVALVPALRCRWIAWAASAGRENGRQVARRCRFRVLSVGLFVRVPAASGPISCRAKQSRIQDNNSGIEDKTRESEIFGSGHGSRRSRGAITSDTDERVANSTRMENDLRIVVKWSGKEYEISDLLESDTVFNLKERIHKETGVRPERQKLLNLKVKGKAAQDDDTMGKLSIKPGFKLMLMGSREEDIAEASQAPENMPDVVNDLDIEEEEVEIEKAEIYLSKIEKRIREYKIEELNPLRENKKLLVLDIDYTLFDHRSVASSGVELMRPYLHEFLTRAYANYEIVIWSATSMKWINEKMKLLGVSSHPDYKIAFHLDSLAMISVHTPKYGVVNVKPLGIIWGRYKQFSAKNTIMFDDIRRNFIMNPQSGLRIRPFKQAHLNRDKDKELLKLADYLEMIAKLDDFSSLNHRKWEEYKSKKSRREGRTSRDDNQNI